MAEKAMGKKPGSSTVTGKRKITVHNAAYMALAFCWSCWLVNFMSRFMVSVSLPVVEDELAITHAMAGLLGTAIIFSYSFSTIPAGFISRRIGANRSITVFLLLLSAAFILIWFARSYTTLLASMVILGLVIGIYLPSAISLLSGWFAGNRLGVTLGIHETAVSTGRIAGAVLVGWLIAWYGEWRLSYLVLVPVVLGLALWSLRVREKKQPALKAPVRKTPLRRNRRTLLYIVPFVFNLFISFGVFMLFTVYLVEVFALDMAAASTLFALVHIGGLFGVVAGGALSDRFGRGYTMLFLLSITSVSLVLIYLLPYGAPLVILWTIVNFTTTAYFPVTFAFVSEVASPASPAPLIGLFTGIGTLVGGASPTIIGAVGDAVGLRAGMLFPVIFAIAGITVLIALQLTAHRTNLAK